MLPLTSPETDCREVLDVWDALLGEGAGSNDPAVTTLLSARDLRDCQILNVSNDFAIHFLVIVYQIDQNPLKKKVNFSLCL